MADYLALDWESHQLSGLEASVSRQGVTIRQAFVFTWPEDLNPEQDRAQAAQWLKTQLAEQNVAARTVLLSLPREDVIVRRLTVPQSPDDELPALVQLQAATKSATPLDQLELDYLPLPISSPEAGRDVLMCTLTRKRIALLRGLLEEAGLELESLGVSSVATAELIAREQQSRRIDSAESALIIARHGHRVEISILQKQRLIFSHSTQIHSEDYQSWGNESAIVAEVQRSLVALHPQPGERRIHQAWLVGQDEEVSGLAAALHKRLGCEAIAFNPQTSAGLSNQTGSWPDPIAAFSGPAGLLLSKSGALVESLDFINPRKARPRRDVKKLRMIAIAAGVVLFIAAAMGYRWTKVRTLKADIVGKRSQIEQLTKTVKAGQPVLESAKLVGEWDQKATDDLGQIGPLHSALPGTHLMYLVEYRLSPTLSSKTSLGQITAVGRAKSEPDVRALFNELAERGIKVKPSTIEESTDSDYPFEFTLDLELPLPPAATVAKTSAG